MTKSLSGVKLIVSGQVQGVGFRAASVTVANKFDVVGSVKNRPDGTVLIYAYATEAKLASFVKAISACPTPFGKVSNVKKITIVADNAPNEFHLIY